MGYTHYWKFTQNPKDIKDGEKKFKKAVELLKKCLAKVPAELDVPYYGKNTFKLAGGNGTGKPVFTDEKVCFNGFDGDEDLSHETCYIALDNPDGFDFDFCKTAEKPYDVAVCLTLLCFKKTFGDDFNWSSDGNGSEYGWKLAHSIADNI
jgi:hypothetical protein